VQLRDGCMWLWWVELIRIHIRTETSWRWSQMRTETRSNYQIKPNLSISIGLFLSLCWRPNTTNHQTESAEKFWQYTRDSFSLETAVHPCNVPSHNYCSRRNLAKMTSLSAVEPSRSTRWYISWYSTMFSKRGSYKTNVRVAMPFFSALYSYLPITDCKSVHCRY
jgi:hypothetical protein